MQVSVFAKLLNAGHIVWLVLRRVRQWVHCGQLCLLGGHAEPLGVGRFPRLQIIWADAAYAGRLVAWAWATGGWLLSVVRRNPDSHQFEVLPRRWVVERTLAWLSRCRRLSKDYEELPETGEAWVHVAMVHLMLKRLKPT